MTTASFGEAGLTSARVSPLPANAIHAPFIDEPSQSALAWPDVWRQFAPCTPYGLRAKDAIRPFLPGDESVFAANAQQLTADAANVDHDTHAHLVAQLQSLPDIAPVLAQLASGVQMLPQKSFLLLKQFAVYGCALANAASAHACTWLDSSAFAQVVFPLKNTEQPTFALEDVASIRYTESVARHGNAVQAHASALRQVDAAWYERVGMRPNRERQLVLPLPEKRDLAATLKQTEALKWLRETPFECVFEVRPTAEAARLQREVEERRRAVEAEADIVRTQLTRAIARHVDAWHELSNAVATLDIRLAKVRLVHLWHGAAPELGAAVVVQGAKHPLVWARKALNGEVYIPLDWPLQDVVNVLSGSNMGGKTVAMSTLCLCQLLAQFGLPVPANRFQTRLFACLRFLSSADTDMENGLSAFGKEVFALRVAWQDMMEMSPSLLCLDEPGRSTNPLEGEALALGILKSARQRFSNNSMLLMASHFPAVANEQHAAHFRVRGLQSRTLAETLAPAAHADFIARLAQLQSHMDYSVELWPAGAPQTEALTVAAWLGLPDDIVQASLHYLSGEDDKHEV